MLEGFPNFPGEHSKPAAMHPVARIGDLWVGKCACKPHLSPVATAGMIITGSGNVITNGIPTARKFDLTLSNCGHIGCLISCSPTTLVNSRPMATKNDIVGCCHSGIVTTGSPDVMNDTIGG